MVLDKYKYFNNNRNILAINVVIYKNGSPHTFDISTILHHFVLKTQCGISSGHQW